MMSPSPQVAEFEVNHAYFMFPHEFSGFSKRFKHIFSLDASWMVRILRTGLFIEQNDRDGEDGGDCANCHARLYDRFGFHAWHDNFSVAIFFEQLTPGGFQSGFDAFTSYKRIPIYIVIKIRGKIAPTNNGGLQQRLLQRF